jgi:hypothetical protein
VPSSWQILTEKDEAKGVLQKLMHLEPMPGFGREFKDD